MRLSKLVSIAAMLAVLAVTSGQLPRILHQVPVAQLHLIQDSPASKWGQAMLLPQTK